MDKAFAKLSIASKSDTKPAIQFASKTEGLASAFLLNVKPGQKVYRYDVEIIKQLKADATKSKLMTKRAPDDGEASLRKIFCMEVIGTFKKETNNFGLGEKGAHHVYDGGKQLYLAAPMVLDAGKKRKEFTADVLSQFCKNQLRDATVSVEISPSQQHEIDISDTKSMYDNRENPADRSVGQFLDLLTNQFAIASLEFVSLGLGNIYQRRGEVMQNKVMELKAGLSKGVQLVEKDGKVSFCLVVDAKKTAFYNADHLFKILEGAGALGRDQRFVMPQMNTLFKGVRASLKYAQSRSIVIDHIGPELAKNVSINGGTIVDYFKRTYQVDINPNLPLVKTDRENVCFPLDCLIVCPNQRVPQELLDDMVRRTILQATAVVPNDRFVRIREQIQNANIKPGNPVMEFFGVKILPTMVEIPIQVRNAPNVIGGKGGKPLNERVANAAWKMSGLHTPTQMLANGFVVLHPKNFDPRKFTEAIISTAARNGLNLGKPSYEEVEYGNYDQMKPKFAAMLANKTRFALAYDTIRNKSHHNLKLLEREFQVLTMQVKIETATRPGGSGQTLENLVLKINAKAMGINFVPGVEACGQMLSLAAKVLVVGLDVSLPARGSPKELFELRKKDLGDLSSHEPACVGLTANCGKQPSVILGDYYYQPASHETLEPELLKANFHKVLDRYVKARGAFPDHVIVLRDGVGNGQLHKTTQAEYPIFEDVCRQLKGTAAFPNIVYMIVTKKHNKRFVVGSVGREANCVPGSVVDRSIVRPDIPEFYMQSHRPIKGTAKSAHYSIMMNPKSLPMDALQAFCNHLCYNHQCVTSAVSLPEPLYHAKEMTKRGKNNLYAKRSANRGEVPRMPNGLMDYNKISSALSYGQIGLGQIKFAA